MTVNGNRVKLRCLALALIGVVALTGLARGAPMVIRYSHVTADVTPKGQAAIKFKELAEKMFPGRVQVKVYPNSQLFGDDTEMQALLLGEVQFIAPSLAKFGRYTHQLQVFDLPFLFKDMAALERFEGGPAGRRLLASLAPQGMHGFGYLHNGMKQLSANTPLRWPHDAKGLRFRIQPSTVLAAQFVAVGAKPRKMAFADTFQALQSGQVDAAENPWSNIYSQGFHTVQKYIMESNHGALEYMVIGNARWWNGLPPDLQKGLAQAMAESIRYGNQIALREEATFRKQVIADRQAQVVTLTDAQLQAWRNAMQPVWKAFQAEIGKDLIDAALQAND
ncbi:MAG: TRAP transporter substrate-binding protein [Rhodoferax sp.]|nr:TRAP transporter substrate-binding protein [Rhodoferax sp.]